MTYQITPDFRTNNSNLPLQVLDESVWPGARVVLDSLDPNCYGGILPVGAIAGGTSLTNLVGAVPDTVVGAAGLPALGTAGWVIDALNRQITLPASTKVVPSVGGVKKPLHFLNILWGVRTSVALTAGQTAVLAGNFTSSADAGMGWALYHDFTNPTRLTWRSCSAYNNIDGIAQGVEFMVAQEVIVDPTAGANGTIASVGYLGTTAVSTVSAKQLPTTDGFPAVGGASVLGHQLFTGSPGFRGCISRYEFHDLTLSNSRSVAEILAMSASQGAGPRFVP